MFDGRRALVVLFAVAAVLVTGCAAPAHPRGGPDTHEGARRDLGAAAVRRDLVFARRDGTALKLDLFLPGTEGPHPLVVYVHGGGWESGTRYIDGAVAAAGTAEALAAERMLERGYAVATVDYRLTGEAEYPAQVVDVADAVRWLRQRAHRWRLDADRIALWGVSAGGHLVSQLGALAGEPQRPGGGLNGVRAVVNWFGPTDMSAAAQLEHPELGEYSRRVVRKLLGCLPVNCPRRADAASPIRSVSGDEPPFLIQHGMADSIVPVEQSLDFAEKLRRLGVPVRMHPYGGVGHGFSHLPKTGMVLDTMIAFLDEHLA